MSLDLVKEVWSELKRHIDSVDRAEAAETLVSVLVDNDIDIDDIRSEFKSDTDIKEAVKSYIADHEIEEDEEDDEEFDEYDFEEDDEY